MFLQQLNLSYNHFQYFPAFENQLLIQISKAHQESTKIYTFYYIIAQRQNLQFKLDQCLLNDKARIKKQQILFMAQEGYKLDNIQALPVNQRKSTDIFCTIINVTFVVLLFLIFIFTFNVENLRKITYPNDAEGRLCGYDDSKYPYLYFTSLTDTSKRLCVSQCPSGNDEKLSCKPTANLGCKKNSNPKYQVTLYDSYLDETRIGLICMPKDEKLREQILSISDTKSKYEFLGFYDAIWRSIWISIIFGMAFFFCAYFQPYITVPWTIFVGGIISIIFGVLILILADGYFLVKLILFIFFVGLGMFSMITIFDPCRRQSIYICSRLMHSASIIEYDKSHTKLAEFPLDGLKKLWKPALTILSFMLLFGAFLVLIGFQVLSAWSCAELVFVQNYPFYDVKGFGSNFLMVLILIQCVWGMSFLKQAFNFIVSSYSAHKYFSTGKKGQGFPLNEREPSYLLIVQMLFRYHWGTVIGGSFLLGFFYFVDLLFDFIFPQDQKIYEKEAERQPIGFDRQFSNEEGYISKTTGFFNIIREETFAYTFLTNLPYCNSSRYCEFLSCQSKFYNYNQSINRLFRLNMHIIPIFFTVLIAMLSMKQSGNSSPYGIICITLITFFAITYPLAYQGDAAQGLLISTFVELAFNDESELEKAPAIIKKAYEEDIKDYYQYDINQENGETAKRAWYKVLTKPTQTE